MTCIVAVVSDGMGWMGGDSLASSGIRRAVQMDKVFVKKDTNNETWLIGCCGSARIGQHLRYMNLPGIDKDQDLMEHAVTKLVPHLKDEFRKYGVTKKDNPHQIEGNIIAVVNSIILDFSADFSVSQITSYSAIGSGEDVAKGALHATRLLPPRERILKALEASSEFLTNVGPPFTIINSNGDREIVSL
jgi:ATP-dependent protease HslVU (ClpYQ) peptidase subunit